MTSRYGFVHLLMGLLLPWALISAPMARANSRIAFAVRTARLIRAEPAVPVVEFGIEAADLEVRKDDQGREVLTAVFTGKLHLEAGTLLVDYHPVTMTSDGSFSIRLPANEATQSFKMQAVSPYGTIQEEIIRVLVRDFGKASPAPPSAATQRFGWNAGVGLTFLSYHESGNADFSQSALTAKATLSYNLVPRKWDLVANTFLTVLPITTSLKGVHATFLGVNARVGYTLPGVVEPWGVSLLGGLYYTTTFVTDSLFGFNNLMGPQVFPAVRYHLASDQVLSGYFKYSPVGGGFALESLGNREIAVGIAWNRFIAAGHPFSVSGDFANLSLHITGDDGPVVISSTTFTVGVSYGF